MAGSGGQRGRAAILCALLLVCAATLTPTALAAAEPAQVLSGVTMTALTTDLDGDGDREIVRLLQEEPDSVQDAATPYAVDAWEHDGQRWSMIGSVELPRARELVTGGQVAALLVSQDAGHERVLVLSAAMVPGDIGGAVCCLRVAELEVASGGGLDLRELQRTEHGAQSAWSADVDGDGSDELVLHEARYGPTDDDQEAMLRVLRWDGTAFQPAFELTHRQLLYGVSVVDTDGVAGKDLLFGPGTDGKIRRLAWADGDMALDEATIDGGERGQGWIAGAADDAIVLTLGQELRIVRWPRGRAPTTVNRLASLGYPGVNVVGDGPDALVVVQSDTAFEVGRSPTVAIRDLGLRLLGEVPAGPGTDEFWRLASGQMAASSAVRANIYPYSGPINGGLGDGRPAFVSSGMLIEPGGRDGYEARPIAPLIGVQPIGLVGPHDGWVALSGGYSPPPGAAYLNGGGMPPAWGRLTVMRVDQLLRPDDDNGVAIDLIGAVEVAGQGEAAMLMAEGDGFKIAVSAPADSAVIVVNGALSDEHTVGGERLIVDVEPPRNRQDDENQEFEVLLLVVTPYGEGVTHEWAGTFVREPPEIHAVASTDVLALSATLTGSASPGSLVSAGGVVIETDDDGRFSASLDAPIWPSRVLVTARDPLGNEASQLVEVVGVVDYRGLPWAAILVAATLVFGGLLYLRTPKRHPAAAHSDGDAQLEELELDAVDGSEAGGR